MTPLAIEILVQCHSSWAIRADAPYLEEAGRMVCEGLLVQDSCYKVAATAKYNLTPRGKALVAMLCQTPLPEEVWTDPRNGLPVPQPGSINEFVDKMKEEASHRNDLRDGDYRNLRAALNAKEWPGPWPHGEIASLKKERDAWMAQTEKWKERAEKWLREAEIRAANKKVGTATASPDLSARCRHCGLHLRHHAPATDLCMDGFGRRFQPMP
jgi:hypothetical protein